MSDGFVDTPYGRVPGCQACGVIGLTAAHVCEHGVTPAPSCDVTVEMTVADRELYDHLRGGKDECPPCG